MGRKVTEVISAVQCKKYTQKSYTITCTSACTSAINAHLSVMPFAVAWSDNLSLIQRALFCFAVVLFHICKQSCLCTVWHIWMPTHFPHRQEQNNTQNIDCIIYQNTTIIPKREIHGQPYNITQIKQTMTTLSPHIHINSEWDIWIASWIQQAADIILISLKAITSSKSWQLRDEIAVI